MSAVCDSETLTGETLTGRERMTLLCESFPTLRGRPGTNPWYEHDFAKWASGPAPSSAIRQAAAFVLAVWNGGNAGAWWNEKPWGVGVFDPVHAMALWDHQHQAAYIAWCNDPFWP